MADQEFEVLLESPAGWPIEAGTGPVKSGSPRPLSTPQTF
jgi:hypothetical protein